MPYLTIDPDLLKEYSGKMRELLKQENHGNADTIHLDADDLLCELLDKLGYAEITEVFIKLEKWYD